MRRRQLGVASDAAKRVIQDIYDTESGPQALDAGMTLRFLENGVFKPDWVQCPMTRAKLENITVDQLVDRFAEIGIAQDQALLYDEYKKFKRLFNLMNEVDQELRRRGLEARMALLRLFNHPNMQVRLKAAKRTLGIAPEAARQVIESISESSSFPQAGEAGMTLSNLDSGLFKPD